MFRPDRKQMATVDPADEKEQRKVEAALEAALIAFELSILVIIAERLGRLDGKTFAEVYAVMPEDIARIREAIEAGTRNIENVTSKVMDNMAKANDDWAEKYYKARNVEQRSAFSHSSLMKQLERGTSNAKRKVSALCRSSVVSVGNRNFIPVEQAYRQIVSAAATAMTTGNLTGSQAISKAVERMAQNGLRVQYESGVTRDLITAVRTNVMDAYRSTMSNMREMQGAEFGADGVEVTAHALCAPDHQPYQGRQYSDKEWRTIQFAPARPLVIGANCGHSVFPIILGITSSKYSNEQLRQLNERSNAEITFEGLSGKELTMTRYEASQYQRKMENNIRKMKENTYLLEKANLSNFAKMERKTQRALSKRYEDISKAMGLTPRMENTRIYISK